MMLKIGFFAAWPQGIALRGPKLARAAALPLSPAAVDAGAIAVLRRLAREDNQNR